MAINDQAVNPHLVELIEGFNELNSATIEELQGEPGPLKFLHYVARNTPLVARGAASHWQATQKWTSEYLLAALGDQSVNVAVTPNGKADAPTEHDDGSIVFAKPHEESQNFSEFFQYLVQQETEGKTHSNSEIRYAQTQNDNLRDEYSALYGDVERDVAFARLALDQHNPDAINLWIGNSHSTTALHRDNYENIYVQAVGRKTFTLLSPVCHACVNEQPLRPATYARQTPVSDTSGDSNMVLGEIELQLDPDSSSLVPFALWDPDSPSENATAYSHLARPVRVTLNPGDMLYLPAMWYHKVAQSPSDGEGFVVAVNYWYDMEFSGPLYSLCSMVRNMSLTFDQDNKKECKPDEA